MMVLMRTQSHDVIWNHLRLNYLVELHMALTSVFYRRYSKPSFTQVDRLNSIPVSMSIIQILFLASSELLCALIYKNLFSEDLLNMPFLRMLTWFFACIKSSKEMLNKKHLTKIFRDPFQSFDEQILENLLPRLTQEQETYPLITILFFGISNNPFQRMLFNANL